MAAFPAVNSLITHSYPSRCFRSREFSCVLCSGTAKDNELKMQGFFEDRKRWENSFFLNKNEINPPFLFFSLANSQRIQRCR